MIGAAVVASLAAAVLAACSDNPITSQTRSGDEKGYVAGDGTVTEFSVDARGEPATASGTDTGGGAVDLADLRGGVVVVNVWYAACGPCRQEAPDLAKIAEDTAAEGVSFVGINTRDSAETASAFERTFDISYPSIVDPGGSTLAGFSGAASPQAVPTTLVLDTAGRVAARILGKVEPSTLRTLIKDTAAEDS